MCEIRSQRIALDDQELNLKALPVVSFYNDS